MKANEMFRQLIQKVCSRLNAFWLVALAFILPIAFACYFYMHGSFQGSAHKNYGELILPPIHVSEVLSMPHSMLKGPSAKPHWTLVYFQRATCQHQCEKRLYTLRQIHTALGKDHARLQRIFYATKPPLKLQQKKLTGMGFNLVQGDAANLNQLAARLHHAQQKQSPAHLADGTIVLIDPRGYLVLFYPKNFKPKDILSDLRHLLKFSQIG